jgi:hypothetical protein
MLPRNLCGVLPTAAAASFGRTFLGGSSRPLPGLEVSRAARRLFRSAANTDIIDVPAAPLRPHSPREERASSDPASDPAPAPKQDDRAPPAPTPESEAPRGRSTGRHHFLFEALEDSTLGSWLLPMIGLGAARSYDASGTIGLAAAAAERRASYRRARTFAVSDETSGGGSTPGPSTRRRRKATSAWLDPLD